MTNTEIGKHIPEMLLEQYAIVSDSLTAQELLMIEMHLQSCPFCAGVVLQFSKLYFDIEQQMKLPIPVRVQKWLDGAGSEGKDNNARIFRLSTFQQPASFHSEKRSFIALAAQDAITLPRFTPVQTLATSDQSILIRVVHDNSSDEYVMQVLSEARENYEQVIVKIEGQPGYFVTDKQGEFHLPKLTVKDVKEFHAYVLLPIGTFCITGDTVLESKGTGAMLLRNEGGSVLQITLDADSESILVVFQPSIFRKERQYVMLMISGEEQCIMAVGYGATIVPKKFLMEATIIKMFQYQ